MPVFRGLGGLTAIIFGKILSATSVTYSREVLVFKLIFGMIKLALLLIVLGLVFHNWTARHVFSAYMRYSLGTPVTIQEARIDFMSSRVLFRDMTMENPADFPSGVMAKIPYLFLDVDLGALLDGKMRFKSIEADISELHLMRHKDGRINWLSLKGMKNLGAAEDPASGKVAPVREFIFTLRRATYRDFGRTIVAAQNFNLYIDKMRFQDLKTVQEIAFIVSRETLSRVGMGVEIEIS